MINWLDNPRTQTEKRIKQLYGRLHKLNQYKKVFLTLYPTYKTKNERIRKMIFKEIRLRESELKEFDKCPKLKFD